MKLNQNIVGVDVGGSHITLAQVSIEKKEIIRSSYVRESVDSFAKKEVIFDAWESAINKVAENLNREELVIGVAMPGPFDYENGIALMLHGKFLDIYNINIKKELMKRLSITSDQIHFVNDAAAFMEGEVFGGSAKNNKKAFGITLGTGLGTTFYNGKLATDEDLWNSEFKESISEDYLATRWFVKRYNEITGNEIKGTKELLDEPKELQKQIFDEYADSLGNFLVKYVKPYSPEVLILGGNIAKAYPKFEVKLRKILNENNFELPIKLSAIFEDAAILGAASYALKKVKKVI